MIILKELQIKNFRNIENVSLKGLKDLNIIIGPNNCGKTSILQCINLLSKISNTDISGNYLDGEKIISFSLINDHLQSCKFLTPNLQIPSDESYLRTNRIEISYYFNPELVDTTNKVKESSKEINDEILLILDGKIIIGDSSSIKDISKEYKEYLGGLFDKDNKYKLTIKQSENSQSALSTHLSLVLIKEVFEEIINDKILLVEDKRIERYKGTPLREYIGNKNLPSKVFNELIEFMQSIVDSQIKDYTQNSLDLIKEIKKGVKDEEDKGKKDNGFITSIEEQGSGVRSLICIAADILSAKERSIILLDEPELGLNPFAKQEFLKFLFKESDNKQIFIATHDPTFVNPILWEKDKVSVYLYSVVENTFKQINLEQNQEDPSVFAGYLPHTVSLKNIHLYVEGTSDVYIFQIFLKKYLKEHSMNIKNSYQFYNKIGIYHLGGSFWEHLLYTIPKPPYKCLVILDGDKREQAKGVIEKYNGVLTNTSKFKFCENLDDIATILKGEEFHPVYCLQKNCIEEYLGFDCKNLPSGFDKTLDGPKHAESLEKIPDEISQLFDKIFSILYEERN